ncbi:MAG: MarC family protein [Candidatus Omnitrophota bacterium]|jgi:multiple antibiotic resistance protein
MMEIIKPYLLTFIPIFVAVDSIGNIPLFISMVEGMSKREKKKIVLDTVVTATLMAVLFMFLGKGVLRLLNITIPDFQIAGGLLLFVISARLLLPGAQKSLATGSHDKYMGVFPMGTPLVTGPAVLTTTLIMVDTFGVAATFVSLVLNMLIVWVTLASSDLIIKRIGQSGTRAFSKIMYILLAAIAVMMTRKGIEGAFLR